MKSRKIIFLFLVLFTYENIYCQDSLKQKGIFLPRDFGNYFLSDHYAPNFSVGIGSTIGLTEYDISSEPRRVLIQATPIVGGQVPIYTYSSYKNKFAFSMPISLSVWYDFTEMRTAPILNTDYRLAFLEFNYSRKFKGKKIKNIGFKFIPFFHESTHLGDELTLSRLRDSIPTTRINVSYETYEFAFLINDSYNKKIKNHSFKFGAKFLINPKKGYYTTDTIELVSNIKINPSKRWIEPFFQYQYQNPNHKFSNKKMVFVFSMDLSLRVRFGYPFYQKRKGVNKLREIMINEAYQPCINTLYGWKLLDSNGELSDFGIYIRAYLGINPHGQFRNIPLYPWFGVNFIYEI